MRLPRALVAQLCVDLLARRGPAPAALACCVAEGVCWAAVLTRVGLRVVGDVHPPTYADLAESPRRMLDDLDPEDAALLRQARLPDRGGGVTSILLVPSSGHGRDLLRLGPCGARPPTAVIEGMPRRRALVLAWASAVVPEGCDRAVRVFYAAMDQPVRDSLRNAYLWADAADIAEAARAPGSARW